MVAFSTLYEVTTITLCKERFRLPLRLLCDCTVHSMHEIGQALSVVALQELLQRLRLDIEAIIDKSAQVCRPVDAIQIQPQPVGSAFLNGKRERGYSPVPTEHVLGLTFESTVNLDLKILVRAFDL